LASAERSPDRILIDDVRFYGQHGVTKAEQAVGAWFSVDVALTLDLAPAALSDDLRATVDYGDVARRIVDIGTRQRVNLIERLAATMAEALLKDFGADEVRVRLRKLTPAMDGVMGTPGVELTRRR
jgi:dihydroneopterin aldolase